MTGIVITSNTGFIGTDSAYGSIDALAWNAGTLPAHSNGTAAQWPALTYAPAIDTFVAISPNPLDLAHQVVISRNGVLWSAQSAAANLTWQSCAWSPSLNLFAAVADSGTNPVMTSPDGVTWTQRTAPGGTWKSIAWSPTLGLFVAVGNNAIMTSPDGVTWTSRTSPNAVQWVSVCWAGGTIALFVAVGGGFVATSSDGITWTSYSQSTGVGTSATPSSVNYGTDDGKVCISCSSGTGVVARSTTAASGSWTLATFGGNTVNFVFRSTATSLWLALGNGQYWTSPDATTWTLRTSPRTASITNWAAGVDGVLPAGSLAVFVNVGLSQAAPISFERDLSVAFDVGITETLTRFNTYPSRDILITWLRRDRMGGSPTFVTDDVPMSEATEAYEVDVTVGGAVVRTFTGLTTNSVVYTAAQQILDGWTQPPDQISVTVYQMSAVVGRGFGQGVTVNVK